MACLVLQMGPPGQAWEGCPIGVGWDPGAGLSLGAGTPGSLCYGAGSQQEVSPRVRRGRVVPGQEVSDSGVV